MISPHLIGWPALIAALTLENADPLSPWRAYLDVLPQALNSPLFWSLRELALLEGTRVAERANARKVEEVYRREMRPFYAWVKNEIAAGKAGKKLAIGAEDVGLRQWKRFGAIVLSYSFSIESGGTVMLPFADFLNSTPTGVNARVCYGDDGGMEMLTTARVGKGSELINSYGERPNSELLVRYGYVAKENPVRVVGVALEEVRAAAEKVGGRDGMRDVRLRVRAKKVMQEGQAPDLAHIEDGPFVVREMVFVLRERWRGVLERGRVGSVDVGCLFDVCDVEVVKEVCRKRLGGMAKAEWAEADLKAGKRVEMARIVRKFERDLFERLLFECISDEE